MKPRRPPDRMSHLEQVVRERMGIRQAERPVKQKKQPRVDRVLDEIEAGIAALEAKFEQISRNKA